jgi:hypothetical protein
MNNTLFASRFSGGTCNLCGIDYDHRASRLQQTGVSCLCNLTMLRLAVRVIPRVELSSLAAND